MVVAIKSNKQGMFLADSPPNPLRGVETTSLLDQARRFVDQGEIDSYLAARGGAAGAFVAMTLP